MEIKNLKKGQKIQLNGEDVIFKRYSEKLGKIYCNHIHGSGFSMKKENIRSIKV